MAVKYYLKLNGIDGDVTNRDYPRWVDVLSYAWDTTRTFGAEGELGNSPLRVTTLMGKHSTPLMLRLATNRAIGEVRLAGVTGSTKFMEIKLTGGLLAACDTAASASADYPAEVYAFRYDRIEVNYWPVANGVQGALLAADWAAGEF